MSNMGFCLFRFVLFCLWMELIIFRMDGNFGPNHNTPSSQQQQQHPNLPPGALQSKPNNSQSGFGYCILFGIFYNTISLFTQIQLTRCSVAEII